MKCLKFGSLAVCFIWAPVSYGFAIQKWRYLTQTSWMHGTAYLWRLKVVW